MHRKGRKMTLCDSHAHIGSSKELEERRIKGVRSLLCAGNPREAVKLSGLASRPEYKNIIIPTYGLHPWYAGRYSLSEMLSYFSECPVIGEIGMDSVWCNVPLAVQEKVFTEQLAVAARLGKPVILHTKGQEQRIASLIAGYPNTYLVHWYSDPVFPKSFLELDCYFSIGPDVWWNPAVRNLAAALPADRILIETDGMGAVKWAYEEAPENLRTHPAKAASLSVPASLSFTLQQIAEIRQALPEAVGEQLRQNFLNCFRLSPNR